VREPFKLVSQTIIFTIDMPILKAVLEMKREPMCEGSFRGFALLHMRWIS
jgi:hypothetical protein